ncbi:probable serine/threonine-protein kinase roco9 isoform X2 [Manduca sexta]|uniref:Leucine-rich repeat-containing protein 27 n=1 Tax=Manduca sexta TaxID=7130 RepID=A0A921ZR98_MANSE|nr:probable serine/threonine-protein kinase roco9 isoform X2 [Manduca sexta]KAG6462434.1 hypothetical protein O3G_MSEX013258 [Manduca sexta]KAG6462435.1 hypothetical protein O3G_MSEX013258 [Manduca sexta]KAG6462436.1 hypothetical protein O3G_MSEX013258 [Manduca sexta]KAG6462437.1 hypothetical protein O3G_MSEX013258 [Manduca sexta]KAG6462438.1 hypothetical protein O3G_MSEX013258 [Manduca sexta]
MVLYLQNNKLTSLTEDFFPSLPNLMYLDLRDNQLTDIPVTIQGHQCLTHLLLQNNRLTSLPNELGSVATLKVLQLAGNPLMFPPREVINNGTAEIVQYLHDKYIENIFVKSFDGSESITSRNEEGISYNSVEQERMKSKTLSVQFNEKEFEDSDDEYYSKLKGKCPKLPKSRKKILPGYSQSAKCLKALYADSKHVQNEKIKQSYLKDKALTKHKDLLATRDKILQDRKNLELLKNWRQKYRHRQLTNNSSYKLEAQSFPYDTNAEHMNFLTREDIEKDLPDKYRRKLVRKCKPTVPRKTNNDVHLAMKIKQLFENLESIDLNREGMTPRTEQKVLLNEIQKISEIKQKLMELSTTNKNSVVTE